MIHPLFLHGFFFYVYYLSINDIEGNVWFIFMQHCTLIHFSSERSPFQTDTAQWEYFVVTCTNTICHSWPYNIIHFQLWHFLSQDAPWNCHHAHSCRNWVYEPLQLTTLLHESQNPSLLGKDRDHEGVPNWSNGIIMDPGAARMLCHHARVRTCHFHLL